MQRITSMSLIYFCQCFRVHFLLLLTMLYRDVWMHRAGGECLWSLAHYRASLHKTKLWGCLGTPVFIHSAEEILPSCILFLFLILFECVFRIFLRRPKLNPCLPLLLPHTGHAPSFPVPPSRLSPCRWFPSCASRQQFGFLAGSHED